MAGLKDEGGRTGDWEGFSSLTTTRLDLWSYRQTHIIFTYKGYIIYYYQESKKKTFLSGDVLSIIVVEFLNVCVTFNWLKLHM